MPHLKLLNDLAINEGSNTRIDGLGFETYAQVLGDAAIGTPGPFTIGVFGEWGTGKTSLMHLTEEYVKHQANGNVITVWFNAWRYEKEEHPIVPLLATIIKELKANQAFTENMSDKGREFINALRAVAYGFSAKSKIKMSGLAEIEASFVAKEMIDRAESLSNDPLLDKSIYYEAFERLSKTTIEGNKKIVVFIDDLDRCFPDLAIKLLESIKLILCQSGFIFILGVARTVIEGYLQHRYTIDYGLENFQGEHYLDKIVQLPFHIPPHKERIKDFCKSVSDQLAPSDSKILIKILPTIAATTGGNPRATIRFMNNLLIDRAINEFLVENEGMEEIPIDFFAITRIIQQQWRRVFSIILEDPDYASKIVSWRTDNLSDYIGSDETDVSFLAKKLSTDRLLNDLLFSDLGINWLSNHDMRNASIVFLKQRPQDSDDNKLLQEKEDIVLQYYQQEDEAIAREIAVELGINGYKVLDADYYITKFINSYDIPDEINNCKAIIICVGKYFDTAENNLKILRFINQMKEMKNKKVLSILLPGSGTNYIPNQLGGYKSINMTNGINVDKLVSSLVSPF